MRIIAGKFKGHPLHSPRGNETRPTTDRVRESVFNLLETRVELAGARVLDLFCGTGAYGLEAVSRGAAEVVFLDSNRQALRTASRNAASLGVESVCSFLQRDGVKYLRDLSRTYEVVFADPPYAFNRIGELPVLAISVLSENGVFILEHDKRSGFTNVDLEHESRSYGRTIVTIFRPSPT